MKYRMKLTSVEGWTITWRGFKVIHDERGFDMWPDTSTLYITSMAATSRQGRPRQGHPVHRAQRSAEAAHHDARAERHRRRGAPGDGGGLRRYFAGTLWNVYGGIAAGATVFDPEPRRARSVRCARRPPRSIR